MYSNILSFSLEIIGSCYVCLYGSERIIYSASNKYLDTHRKM